MHVVMRTLLAIFLSIMLSFNAAYAALTDVCDVLENVTASDAAASGHGTHLGHHTHDHEHPQTADSSDGSPEQSPQTAHVDHSHPHQCFSSVLPDELALPPLSGAQLCPVAPDDQLLSVSPPRLERPPRVATA